MTLLARYPPMWKDVVLLCLLTGSFLAYWFRRNVLATLKSRQPGEHVEQVCRANDLHFLDARRRLSSGASVEILRNLAAELGRDFTLVVFLLRHAGGAAPVRPSFMERMLMLDFRLMQLWFWLSLRFSSRQPARALEEMISILSLLADALGRRLASRRYRASAL
ncbi:MAG: hypothetical protein ACP5U2_14880 [Bryobacteraceae bacterium]